MTSCDQPGAPGAWSRTAQGPKSEIAALVRLFKQSDNQANKQQSVKQPPHPPPRSLEQDPPTHPPLLPSGTDGRLVTSHLQLWWQSANSRTHNQEPTHRRTPAHAHSTPNNENYVLHVLLSLQTFPQTFQESRGSLPRTSRPTFDTRLTRALKLRMKPLSGLHGLPILAATCSTRLHLAGG